MAHDTPTLISPGPLLLVHHRQIGAIRTATIFIYSPVDRKFHNCPRPGMASAAFGNARKENDLRF
jgi:hypothetical protein